MTRIGAFRGGPWRGLLAAGVAVLALSVGLARGAGAATRFVATTGNDSSNTCLASGSPCKTITRALTQAVADDTIQAAAGTYDTALGETFPLDIVINLTLTGAGAGSTIIDATGANSGVMMVGFGQAATIAGVTIAGGAVSCTNSGDGECNAVGGGLFNAGTLTVTNSTVSGNTATCTNSGSGQCSGAGAGLGNFGTMTVTSSTVSGNTATCTNSGGGFCTAQGAGLFSTSFTTLTVTNSTVTGNTATCTNSGGGNSSCFANGGGLGNFGTLTVTSSTVTANTVTCSGAGCGAVGGGLRIVRTTTVQNTIVAKQLAGLDCDGTITSLGHNLSSDASCGFAAPGDLSSTDPLLGPLADNGGPTFTHALLPGSPAIDGVTSGCPPPSTDQRGFFRPVDGDGDLTATCDIGAYEFASSSVATLTNISTRGLVQTGDNVMIGGFIIGGDTPKRVLVRAIGPSLANFNVPGVLANPVLQLFSGQTPIAENNDWQVTDLVCQAIGCGGPADIAATGSAPSHPLEAAILITLDPGPYTAIVSGVGGATGVGLVEVFEVDGDSLARLTNISTRALVQTDANVMIGGFIIEGDTPKTVMVRAIGPSLANFNVPGALANPVLQLFSGQTAIAENEDWQTPLPLCAQSGHTCGGPAEIATTGSAPSHPLEAALLITLPPGPYTAIVSGVGGSTGVGLVEVFEVP